jgi:DNA-binding NarL/FixJ family response regulator
MSTNVSEVSFFFNGVSTCQNPIEPQREPTPRGRAMLVGRPCLAFECLREAMNVRGIETYTRPLDQRVPAPTIEYDVLVLFLVRGDVDTQSMIVERMHEVRSQLTRLPSVALVEDPNSDAAAISRLGFTTVVLGLPSLPFAIDIVQLLLLGSRQISHLNVRGRENYSVPDRAAEHSEDNERETSAALANVYFTKREMELLDLLRRGMQNKLMAYELGISQSTVKAHLRSIMMKLNAKNRTQALCKLTLDIEHRVKETMHG